MSWPNKIYSKSSCKYRPDYNDTSLGISYDGLISSGTLIDTKNFLNLGRVRASSVRTLTGKQLKCTDNTCMAGQLNVSSGFPAASAIPLTVTAIVHPHPSGNQCIAVATRQNAGTADSWNMFLAGSNLHVERYDYNGSANGYYRPAAITAITGLPFFALGGIDPVNNTINVGMNGILYSGFTAGVALAYSVKGFFIGGFQDSSSVSNFLGRVGNVSLYNQLKDAVWFRKEWVKIAKSAQLKAGWGSKVSIANENTAGNFIGNGSTPFEILSGTWKVSTQLVNGELHKVIECVASGTAWLDRKFMNVNSTEASYGSWRLSYGHAKDTVNVAHIGLTSTNKAAWDAASNTGYVIRMSATAAGDKLLRYSGGGAANLCFNMPNSAAVTNQIHITRRFDNSWQGYHMPNIVTSPWTPSTDGPFVDSTYTTSAGMSFTFNAGDWVSLGNVRDAYALTKYLGEFDPREV